MSKGRDNDRPGRAHDPLPWYAEAILAALAGGLFGLAIAAVLALGLAFDYPPMVAIERLGIDLSLNALADSGEGGAASGQAPPSFVFVDIDRDACHLFARKEPPPGEPYPDAAPATPCEVSKPAPQSLILDFVRAAASSTASVLVLDIATPDNIQAAASLRAGLSAVVGGPWIIVEAAARPDDDTASFGYFGDAARDTATWPVTGKVRPALMAPTTDPGADDGVIRQYPPGGWIDIDAAKDRYLPSAPYLAALLADPRSAAMADCVFYRTTPACEAEAHRAGLWTSRHGRPPASPIHYRFKSLSLDPDSRATALAELRYRGRYDRYEASDLLKNGAFVLDAKSFAGKTIVLGSSLRSGMDWHATPVGPMSGAEVMINAANSFAEFGVQPDAGPSDVQARMARWSASFGEKALGVAYATVLMTPVWFIIYGLCHFSGPRTRLVKAMARLGCAAIFVGGLLFVLRFELGHATERLRATHAMGHSASPVDLLGPTLGVGLEGYSVFSSWLTRSFEALLVAIWGFAVTAIRPRSAGGDET